MIGIDMVYIPRVQNILERRGEAFLEKVFSREERRALRMDAAHIAGRFAAKEAMAKALGDGIFKAGLKNLIVETDDRKRPFGRYNDRIFRLSVSHEKDYAVAVARLEDPRALPLSKEVANLLPMIQQTDHKGSRGRAALVGGSEGMYGSLDLSTSAALRAGCGLSYAFVPDEIFRDFSLRMREVIVKKQSAIDELAAMDAIGLGPGMGRSDKARDIFLKVYALSKPMVVDADGLYHLAQEKPAAEGEKIYTPHEGEMARLLDRDISWIRAHRDEAVDKFLARHGGVVVLKGHESIVASKEERATNETGNAGMATAGSGDVLTGIITACLAQGMNCFQAARLGVYIHGLAGDLGALHKSERGLIASDLITYLPEAFLHLEAIGDSAPAK